MNELLGYLGNLLNSSSSNALAQASSNFYFSNIVMFKAISILLTILFIAATAFFISKTGWLALKIDRFQDVVLRSNMPKKRSIKAWGEIQRHFFLGSDNDLKVALFEADNLLNEALRLAGFKGENLGDRLKNITPDKLPNIQDIWEAHKLRNRLVHEADFKLSRDTAERALTIYENAFKDIGLLD